MQSFCFIKYATTVALSLSSRRVVDLTLPQYYFESREVESQNVKKASVQITSLRYHTYFTTALGCSQYEPHNLEPNWYGNVKIPDEGSFFDISRCRQNLKPSHYYTQLFLRDTSILSTSYTIIFPRSSNQITDLWPCRCCWFFKLPFDQKGYENDYTTNERIWLADLGTRILLHVRSALQGKTATSFKIALQNKSTALCEEKWSASAKERT